MVGQTQEPVAALRERVRRLEQTQERLHHVIEGTVDALVVVDAEGTVRFANAAAESLFGRPRNELVGSVFGQPLVAGETTEVDLHDGRVAEMRAVESSWEDHRRAWIASLRDVTERRAAELAERHLAEERAARREAERQHGLLEEAMKRLREEDRRKDQFMAVLGHELRNPLAGIDNGLRLLEQDVGAERRRWALEMMRRQVMLLTNLLDDLLDVSRIARGKLELRPRQVEVGEMLRAVETTARPRLQERSQTLDLDPGDPVWVEADPARFEQVLINLLVNASKYSPDGSTIHVRARREGEQALVEVADHGIGIDSDMLEQIFEPFIQGQTDSPVAGGLGIGLTLVKRLIELHAGAVEATSPGAGKGSTFTVRLPIADGDRAEPAGPEATAAPAAAAPDRHILVIDDNTDAANALLELLQLHGYEAESAADGRRGLAQARRRPPDVVLLDLDLPGLTGYEVAAEMRRDPLLRDAHIVAVSGFGNDRARERSRESGIDRHVLKPVDFPELVRLLADLPPCRAPASPVDSAG